MARLGNAKFRTQRKATGYTEKILRASETLGMLIIPALRGSISHGGAPVLHLASAGMACLLLNLSYDGATSTLLPSCWDPRIDSNVNGPSNSEDTVIVLKYHRQSAMELIF